MTDVAAQVPSKYDVVIDGHGYVFLNSLMQSMPFRNQRAAYSYSKTFIERSNVSGKYGDNDQDFFLTVSQNDWSEGEGELFFRGNDPNRSRQFFSGVAVDTTTAPGRVTMRPATTMANPTGSVIYAMCPIWDEVDPSVHAYCSLDTATPTLHTVSASGTDTSIGAHGAGVVNPWGMCHDGSFVYIAGATKLRRWSSAAGFSDFSAQTNAGSLAFLNNALYSCDASVLRSYDTGGSASTIYTWKNAVGTARSSLNQSAKLAPFGGQLLIYWQYMNDGPELWLYDGTSTYRVAVLPAGMVGYDIRVISGIVYLSGLIFGGVAGTTGLIPVVYYYNNGTLDELWRSSYPVSGTFGVASNKFLPALGEVGGKLTILDQASKRVMEYDPGTGAISNVTTLAVSGSYASSDLPMVSSAATTMLFDYDAGNSSTGNTLGLYPSTVSFATTSTVTSALVDFDNSLTKIMRGVKTEWFGSGTVDIAYLIDGDPLTGSYTSLRTAAVSGTEYLFPASTTGRAVSVKVTLNNSGGQPTLTRVYVRAAPIQQSFRRCQYVLDLTGDAQMKNPVVLRDNTLSTLTGQQMATNLSAAITSTTPVQIYDRFGGYLAVAEQGEGVTELDEVRPGEFIAQTTWREV